MRFSSLVSLLTLSIQAYSTPTPIDHKHTNDKSCKLTAHHHRAAVNAFLNFWAGDLDSVNETVTTDFRLFQDRIPTANGSMVYNPVGRDQLVAFAAASRDGFDTYFFEEDFHFGKDDRVVLRWRLNATASGPPASVLPKGTFITYNGTDILYLERCSGLIREVLSSQDFITYFHEIQVPVGLNGLL